MQSLVHELALLCSLSDLDVSQRCLVLVALYLVRPDYAFHCLRTFGDEFETTYSNPTCGVTFASTWKGTKLYTEQKRLPRGTFISVTEEMYVCTRETAESFGDLITRDGELLPVSVDDVSGHFVSINVVTAVSALNRDQVHDLVFSKRPPTPLSSIHCLAALDRPMLCKDRELPESMLLCVSGFVSRQDDFLVRYRELGCTGLDFHVIWSE